MGFYKLQRSKYLRAHTRRFIFDNFLNHILVGPQSHNSQSVAFLNSHRKYSARVQYPNQMGISIRNKYSISVNPVFYLPIPLPIRCRTNDLFIILGSHESKDLKKNTKKKQIKTA